jgi:hypothetical protein
MLPLALGGVIIHAKPVMDEDGYEDVEIKVTL